MHRTEYYHLQIFLPTDYHELLNEFPVFQKISCASTSFVRVCIASDKWFKK